MFLDFDIIQEEKEDVLEVIKTLSQTCHDCRLSLIHPENKGLIWRGSPLAKIAIVGEAPGDKETEAGLPMVGPSGKEFERWARILEIDTKTDVLITNTVQCFTGDSLVKASGIEKAYRREYTGDLVTVKTSINEITGTPNHPVLTQRGWVPLGLLNQEDSLVNASSSKSIVFSNPHVQNIPTKFVELFDTLSDIGSRSRVIDPIMNFHGDGTNGQVDVISFNTSLGNDNKSFRFKSFLDLFFKRSNNRKIPFFLSSSSSSSSCLRLLGFRDSSRSFIRSFCNKFPFRKSRRFISDLLSLPIISKFKSFQSKVFSESGRTDAETLGQGILAFPSDVSLDRIVHINRKLFVGHVYNLQTTNNYYSINGYVVHNCQPRKSKTEEGTFKQDKPDTDEIELCFEPRCMRLLRALPNLEVVIALGWIAASALLGTEAQTKSHQGQWFASKKLPGKAIYCMFHPAYLLHQPSQEKKGTIEEGLKAFKRDYLDPKTSKILKILEENEARNG